METTADRQNVADFIEHSVSTADRFYKARQKVRHAVAAYDLMDNNRKKEKIANAAAASKKNLSDKKKKAHIMSLYSSVGGSLYISLKKLKVPLQSQTDELTRGKRSAAISSTKGKSRNKFSKIVLYSIKQLGSEIIDGYVEKSRR